MATITAGDVAKLRAATGAGLMDCKKALTEMSGDFDKAVDWLRKKGKQIAEKKAEREIKAGAVFVSIDEAGKRGALLELGCETDFVAKNDEFQALGSQLAAQIAKDAPAEAAGLAGQPLGGAATVKDALQALSAKSGENVQLGRFARFEAAPDGGVFHYLHFTGTTGVLLELEGSGPGVVEHEEAKALAKELCLHIAFKKPVGLTRESVPAEVVAREREVHAQSDALKGKPENILQRIIDGKLEAFFKEQCLLDQGFVKEEKKPVRDLLAEVGKKAGGKLEVKRFATFSVGGK